jgi:predicted dehydrogenase
MRSVLRWGVLGTGNIANVFAAAIRESENGQLVAVASRHGSTAEEYAVKYALERYYGSYNELLRDDGVDAVYIALPHNLHAEWSVKAARSKKHILCEKPCAINYHSAKAVIEEVRRNDVFYMEAFMYRCHKQTKKMIELLRNKVIGDVRFIEASFCYNASFSSEQIEQRKISGGGGILDVGCYPVSMARLIAGIENEVESISPIDVCGMGHVGNVSEYDEWSVSIMRFDGEIMAQLSTSVSLEHRNDLRIFGTKGSIYIPSPWVPGGAGPGTTSIFLKRNGDRNIEEIKVTTDVGLYAQEIDVVSRNIHKKQAMEMSWLDTLLNMETIERWRAAINMKYTTDSYIC